MDGFRGLLWLGLWSICPLSGSFGATWSRLATHGAGPSERSSPTLAVLDHRIYLFGGLRDDFRSQSNRFFNDLYRFDRRIRRWTQLNPRGDLPPARAFAVAASEPESGLIVIFGGAHYEADLSELKVYSDLWVYSAWLDSWTQLRPANPGPSGRSRPAAWMVGERFYIFGGMDESLTTRKDLWVYDLGTNRWSDLGSDGPPARHEAQSSVKLRFGKLYLYGGESAGAEGFQMLNDTWAYEVASNRWSEETPAAEENIWPARNYGAAGMLGAALYLYGGDLPGGNRCCGAPFPQNPCAELWRFDLHLKRWDREPLEGSLPRLKRHSAIELGPEVLFFCGFDFEPVAEVGQIWNREVYVLRP